MKATRRRRRGSTSSSTSFFQLLEPDPKTMSVFARNCSDITITSVSEYCRTHSRADRHGRALVCGKRK